MVAGCAYCTQSALASAVEVDMSFDRRSLLKFAATLPIAASGPRLLGAAENPLADKVDYTLRIAPIGSRSCSAYLMSCIELAPCLSR